MGNKTYDRVATGLRYRTYQNESGAYELTFQYKGKPHTEIYKLPRTPTNDMHMEALRNRAVSEISLGIFNYATIFPESKNALRYGHTNSKQTVKELLTNYLADIKLSKEAPTYRVYRKPCQNLWIPILGRERLCDIDGNPGPIREVLRDRAKTVTLRTLRNDCTPFRSALDLALADNKIEQNPFDRIKLKDLVRVRVKSGYKIDPYDMDEITALLETCREISPGWEPYWKFVFFSGVRTSEGYALRWSNVDLFKSQAFIDSAVVERAEKIAKTDAGERTLELLPAAVEALKAQRVYSKPEDEFVFLNPRTGNPIISYDTTTNILRKLCLRSGVRYRMQRQTRHSYASNLLSGGEIPLWVSQQLGHTTVEMVFKIYGRWIAQASTTTAPRVSAFANTSFRSIRPLPDPRDGSEENDL